MATIEITPTVISVGLTIFVLIVGSIIGLVTWLVTLREKVNQVEEKTNDMKMDFREYDRRLRDVESKLNAYNIAESLLDYLRDKK